MNKDTVERNGMRGTLLSERIVFAGGDGEEFFSADLVALEMELEHLCEHGKWKASGRYADYVEEVRQSVSEQYSVDLTTSQIWCLLGCVRRAWEQFKKKFDAELMLLTTTDSTPSPSTTERPTITPQSCPES